MVNNLVCILLVSLIGSASTGSSWWSKQYTDGHELACIIYDEALKLSNDTSKKDEFVHLLSNKEIIFTETNGSTVTVRDVAFTVLDEAGLAEQPVKSAKVKFIYSCTINDSLYRSHIAVLNDDDFARIIKSIQKSALPERQENVPVTQ